MSTFKTLDSDLVIGSIISQVSHKGESIVKLNIRGLIFKTLRISEWGTDGFEVEVYSELAKKYLTVFTSPMDDLDGWVRKHCNEGNMFEIDEIEEF